MSNESKSQPNKKDTKISSADDLIKTNKSTDIELDESELKRVSGGKSCAAGVHRKEATITHRSGS